ncbi:hypothetical protein J6590_107910, partial [Homalodisca vitripennis]
ELYDIADPGTVVVSLENAVFVSGRYLELRLLQKLREFYNVHCAVDAVKLFAWMCFGITTDEVFQGNGIMAASYAKASTNPENPNICWNYPLATMIRARPDNVAEPRPLLIYDKTFSADLTGDLFI